LVVGQNENKRTGSKERRSRGFGPGRWTSVPSTPALAVSLTSRKAAPGQHRTFRDGTSGELGDVCVPSGLAKKETDACPARPAWGRGTLRESESAWKIFEGPAKSATAVYFSILPPTWSKCEMAFGPIFPYTPLPCPWLYTGLKKKSLAMIRGGRALGEYLRPRHKYPTSARRRWPGPRVFLMGWPI